MQITAKQIIELAMKYVGYKEKASNKDLYSFEDNAGKGNYTMFQEELAKAGFWNNNKQGYEWCTSFVAWCFWRILGKTEAKRVLCLTGPYGASCISWAKYYAQQGRLYNRPKVGDQYFKKDSRDGLPCHTGIVESVRGNTFVTIEGNADNMVKRVNRTLDNTVYGFGRPHYSSEQEEEDEVRYKTINDIPEGFYRNEAQKLVDEGILKGSGDGVIDISKDMLRCMIFCRRMCDAVVLTIPNINKEELLEELKKNIKLTVTVD